MWELNPMKGARGGAIGLQVSNDVAFFEKINVWLFLWNRVWNLTNNLQIVQTQRFG